MLQPLSKEWVEVPTALDNLYFPDLIALDAAPESRFQLLVAPTVSPDRPAAKNYLVTFYRCELIYAYSEILYANHAPEQRTGGGLMRAVGSELLERARATIPAGEHLEHYVICGGNGCWEVVAESDPVIRGYDTFNAAVAAASSERMQ